MTVRQLSDAHVGYSKRELVAQRNHSARVVRFFGRHHWMVAARHSTCWRVPWSRTCNRARALVRAHRWLRGLATQRLAKLFPPPVVAGHYAGWSCITNGAYPGAPHEGNGYNGAYTGPLGMTTPWAGYMPPGSDWVHSPVGSVYAIAERVAAGHGWSYSWMRGQWPATFPPCAGLFG